MGHGQVWLDSFLDAVASGSDSTIFVGRELVGRHEVFVAHLLIVTHHAPACFGYLLWSSVMLRLHLCLRLTPVAGVIFSTGYSSTINLPRPWL